jgi:hypothetical protein
MKAIPDTSKWLPRQDAIETLKDIFYKRCAHSESLIINKSKQEQELNIDNFDSGLGVEDLIREEISKLIPERYFVTKGVINDRNGLTAGDQDIIVFNKYWFPVLKAGTTEGSRKFHFPIEGTYAIGEVKQTLTFDSLDDAMKKLVISKRLERPKTGKNRIVENRELASQTKGFTNPLYTFIIATRLEESVTFDDIFKRFYDINKTLKREEIINCLCILQKGSIFWSYLDKKENEWKPAMFYEIDRDLAAPIVPVFVEADQERKISLYSLIINLYMHLNSTILASEDLAVAYGNYYDSIKMPSLDDFLIRPE